VVSSGRCLGLINRTKCSADTHLRRAAATQRRDYGGRVAGTPTSDEGSAKAGSLLIV
jgi:hypothetical protein